MFFEDASVTVDDLFKWQRKSQPKIRKSVLDMVQTNNAGDSASDARSVAASCRMTHVGSNFKKPGGEQVQGV